MPARVVLNVVYAMLVDGRDEKQRRELDDKLYGFDAINEEANRALWDRRESGGEG